jgi:hypothetical protein
MQRENVNEIAQRVEALPQGETRRVAKLLLEFANWADALGKPGHAGFFRATARILLKSGPEAAKRHIAKHGGILYPRIESDRKRALNLVKGLIPTLPKPEETGRKPFEQLDLFSQ